MHTIESMSAEVVNSLPESLKELVVNFGPDKIFELISKVGGELIMSPKARRQGGEKKEASLPR